MWSLRSGRSSCATGGRQGSGNAAAADAGRRLAGAFVTASGVGRGRSAGRQGCRVSTGCAGKKVSERGNGIDLAVCVPIRQPFGGPAQWGCAAAPLGREAPAVGNANGCEITTMGSDTIMMSGENNHAKIIVPDLIFEPTIIRTSSGPTSHSRNDGAEAQLLEPILTRDILSR